MSIYQLYIWNYWRCVEKQLNLPPPPWKFVSFLLQLQFCFAWLPRSSVAICFCPPLLRCCCWSEEPDRKGFLLSSSFSKTSLELFFDLTDSVKWSLNPFPKRFSSLVSSNSTLFLNEFFASWWEHTLDRMLYLWWYEIELPVWPSKQMVCSRRLRTSSRDKGGASDFLAFSNFNHTLDKGPITETGLFCIFPRISSIAKGLFLFFSFNRSFKNSFIFLTWFKLFGMGCTSQIVSWSPFSGMYFSNCVFV